MFSAISQNDLPLTQCHKLKIKKRLYSEYKTLLSLDFFPSYLSPSFQSVSEALERISPSIMWQ